MKNTIKIALLIIVALVLFIFGFAFLKGNNLLNPQNSYYAIFDEVEGLYPSSQVLLNGLQIGRVSRMDLVSTENGSHVLVTIDIDDQYELPSNSIAILYSGDFLGDKSLKVIMGNSDRFLKDGDTLTTEVEQELMDQLGSQLEPLTDKVERFTVALDTILTNVQRMFDEKREGNIYAIMKNVEDLTSNLNTTIIGLNQKLNQPNSSLNQSLDNLAVITTDLTNSTQQLDMVLNNVEQITSDIAEADVGQTITNAKIAMEELNLILNKINNGNGTVAELLQNPEMYNNLKASTNNLNLLLKDLKENPKRYVHFSVFGGKNKDNE